MALERDLRLIVALEGVLILLLLFFNAYLLSRRPILAHLREIYFVNSAELRSAWYVVLTGGLLLVVSQSFTLLEFLGLAQAQTTLTVSVVLQFGFASLLIVAFFQTFRVLTRYVQRIPISDREIENLIKQDMRRVVLLEDYESNAALDLRHAGDVFTGRPRLGPYISLTHYRGLANGFALYTERKLGHLSDALLYSVGRLTARSAMSDILHEAGERDLALKRVFEEIRANGIAIPEVVGRNEGRVDVRLYENAVSAGVKPEGRAICHYQSGMLAGIFEVLTGRYITGRETKCWGLGDQFCEFELDVGPPLHEPPGNA